MPRSISALSFARRISEPTLSPDGQRIAYISGIDGKSYLCVMDVSGAQDHLVSDIPLTAAYFGFGSTIGFAPDSAHLYCISRDGVLRYGLSDGTVDLVVVGGAFSELAISPDGKLIAVVDDMASVSIYSSLLGAEIVGPMSTRTSKDLTHRVKFDFVLHPRFSANSDSLFAVVWSNPNMPWDGSSLVEVPTNGSVADARTWIDEVDGFAISQPFGSQDGSVMFLSDHEGYLVPHTMSSPTDEVRPLYHERLEVGEPDLSPGQRSWAVEGKVAVLAVNREGFGELVRLDLETGVSSSLKRGVFGSLSIVGDCIVGLRSGARLSPSIVTYDCATNTMTMLRSSHLIGTPRSKEIEPEVFSYRSSSDILRSALGVSSPIPVEEMTIYGRMYRPNSEPRGVIISLHGGPTSQTRVQYSPRLSYLLDAGYLVVQVDYRGSSGWGRRYRDALLGLYGVADIVDALCVIAHLDATATRGRLPIFAMGGSSAGLTSLGMVAWAPSVVAGAIAPYPVTDLIGLAETTHRFERCYFESLVGEIALHRDRYRERSPMHWRFDGGAILIFQGDGDPVVPVELTRKFVRRVGSKVDVSYVEYPGAGHGWSSPEILGDEVNRIMGFLERVSSTTLDRYR